MAGLLGASPIVEAYAISATATMVNNQTIFTIANGPVLVVGLVSLCVTNNDATASTLQYSSVPTVGSAQTISAASASLANATAGASVSLIGTALTTAANLSANGANLGMTAPLFIPVGIIKMVVGVGSTTGTWQHYIYYRPLTSNAIVS